MNVTRYYKIADYIIKAQELPAPFEGFMLECQGTQDCANLAGTAMSGGLDAAAQETSPSGYLDAHSAAFPGTIAMEIVRCEAAPEFKVKSSFNYPDVKVSVLADGGWLFESTSYNEIKVWTNADYTRMWYTAPEDADDEGKFYLQTVSYKLSHLLRCVIESRLLFEKALPLHSACININGEAICFSGNSGVGKSTRAQAWIDAIGAELISGDRPMILTDKGMVCGVPWDGKEGCFNPKNLPLKAVVVVRRALFTKVRKMHPKEAREFILNQCFLPMWDNAAAFKAMENVMLLTANVPFYYLFSDRDEASALKARDIIFNHPEQIHDVSGTARLRKDFEISHINGDILCHKKKKSKVNFDGALQLNDVSEFILNQMKERISTEDLVDLILSEYDVDRETAAADLEELLKVLESYGMLG
ncbi:MAG: PqqD family peptide modification chaperone [Parasporobacterium sp.]|nr:PqqD family peptide modification chaperone [Parasporobacterium sp.]